MQGITDLDNGKTLAELNFKKNETINLYKKQVTTTSNMPLLNPDNRLNARATDLFTNLFNMFAVEDPSKPGEKFMGN